MLPPLPKLATEPFLKLWEQEVFALLLAEGKITEDVVANMRSWKHSGFSVDQSVRLEAGDQEDVQRLIPYFLRCPFSQARMIEVVESDPLTCPKCGMTMCIIAFIERRQTEVIRRRSSSYGGTSREDSPALRTMGRQFGPRPAGDGRLSRRSRTKRGDRAQRCGERSAQRAGVSSTCLAPAFQTPLEPSPSLAEAAAALSGPISADFTSISPTRSGTLQAPEKSKFLFATLTNFALTNAWRAGGAPGLAVDNWLVTFQEAQLNALVPEAVTNNLDLRVTATRVAQAAEYVEMAKAALRPAVSLLDTGGLNMGGGDVSSALQGASLGASREPDLWGRMRYGRNAVQATRASAMAADFPSAAACPSRSSTKAAVRERRCPACLRP